MFLLQVCRAQFVTTLIFTYNFCQKNLQLELILVVNKLFHVQSESLSHIVYVCKFV